MTSENPPKITYWYHPESDCLWIHNSEVDGSMDHTIDEGRSIELDEYKYVQRQIELIDKDPLHDLPEGITAVIKLAQIYGDRTKYISGMIYYDKNKRFVEGYPINTTPIVKKEPGGIYTTSSGSKYLVEVLDGALPIGDING